MDNDLSLRGIGSNLYEGYGSSPIRKSKDHHIRFHFKNVDVCL